MLDANRRDLVIEAHDLIRSLGGHPHGEGGLCRCPAHDDVRPSLSVRAGNRALLFKCFAGCDTLDVIRALRSLGIPLGGSHAVSRSIPSAPDRRHIGAARRLWDEAAPLSLDAARYLAGRGLTEGCAVLRFHGATPLGRGRNVVRRPALLVAVTTDAGLTAVQRCFLDGDGVRLARDLREPRRMLGRPGVGAVRLAPAEPRLGLAEGLETARSAMLLLDLPVWAALGAERFGRVAIPEIVEELVLLPDNDRAGMLAVARATTAYARPGRRILTHWPPAPFNDWNDLLRAEGEGDRWDCG